MSVTYRVIIAAGLSMAIASHCFADEPSSSGTGFAVTTDGWILTNAHVVQDCGRIEVKGKGDATDPRIDEINDLAVVKISASEPLKPLVFRKSPTRLGEDIVAVGYPLATLLADSVKITTGNVNALAGIRNDTRYIQISTPIQPGNSGGPVVDRNGYLLGITSATLSKKTADEIGITAQNVNFAIRASVAELFMQSQSLVDQADDTTENPTALSTADLADRVTPSVFQILCYPKADARVAIAPEAPNSIQTQPPASSVNLPTENAVTDEPSLEVPHARSGFVRHPKGVAPIKSAASGDAKTIGQAPNGSPVEVTELLGDWYRVAVKGSSGYMHYSWVRVNQFEEPAGDGRFVQVKSFRTLEDARSFIKASSVPLAAHLAANGWIAVTLHGVYGEQEAKDLSNALKAHGLIAKDAMVTFGNTYVRKVCCD
ncbi:trypsin-like peptidase domain-containing protein [Sinorhizobium meliloti]|uniref:trypsin-like peptidase domain-containing protein n=1 Tax=Rhizobium meliloti TaxID=382 RepID=UPI000D1DE087|nr:trypsin-like peptidase domain-containing protein [Sinorhizobium meliloti]RMI22764.1 serine protease [Sinorhizobium meliloti]RVK57418.1 serine protease [Sinorhizobium meliloti]